MLTGLALGSERDRMSIDRTGSTLFRCTLALVLICLPVIPPATAADPDEAGARLRQLLERTRDRSSARPTSISPQAASARERLLETAEVALSRGEVDHAHEQFEQAAAMLHAADAELGIVRAHMQAGRYRQALAFAAHTAGAHPDTPAGAALYAWLLHLGGHKAPADQVVTTAKGRMTEASILADTAASMASDSAANNEMLLSPARFAPYSPTTPVGLIHYRTVGTGYVLAGAERVITDADLVRDAGGLAVRNGLGRYSSARIEAIHEDLGIAVLALPAPLDKAAAWRVPGREPFPGSMAYAVRYPQSVHDQPSWPQLHPGFLGSAQSGSSSFALGVDVPGRMLGGPVFDASGRFIGLSRSGRGAAPMRVALSALKSRLGVDALGQVDVTAENLSSDAIYEQALATTVQLIVTY